MKVLVTGHKGYIGVVLTPMLLEAGYEVVGMDSDLYRFCDYAPSPNGLPALTKDIRDAEAADFKGVDAWRSSPKRRGQAGFCFRRRARTTVPPAKIWSTKRPISTR